MKKGAKTNPRRFRFPRGHLAALAIVVLAQGSGMRSADAQETESRRGSQPFDSVTVERIRPEALPDYRPGLPEGSGRRNIDDLPRNLNAADLETLVAAAETHTFILVAIRMPPHPYRQVEMVYRGHAIAVSPHRNGSEPTLITTADWVEGAESLYLFPAPPNGRGVRDQLPRIQSENTAFDATISNGPRFLAQNREHLVEVAVRRSDQHVNLAELVTIDSDPDVLPDTGLVLHDMARAMPERFFGYSPLSTADMLPGRHITSVTLPEAFSFYFLTDIPAILSAPVLSGNGSLVAITALRLPTNNAFTLTIAPGAIHYFLKTAPGRPEISHENASQ